jgi:F420-dependent methylenetetrahydromethanopterin dehydrogenase
MHFARSGDSQEAKQDVVVVAGGKEMLRDAMLRAAVNREIFTSNNLLVRLAAALYARPIG